MQIKISDCNRMRSTNRPHIPCLYDQQRLLAYYETDSDGIEKNNKINRYTSETSKRRITSMQAAAAFSFLPFGYSEIFGVVKKVAIRQKKGGGNCDVSRAAVQRRR